MALSKITADSIATNAVSATLIADGSITNVKLGSDIDASKLVTGTLPNARIADNTLDGAKLAAGTVAAAKLASGAARSNFGAGTILQVVFGELTSRVVYNQQSFGDIGLQATITPSSTSSRIYIVCTFGRCTTSQTNNDHGAAFRLLRNGVDSDLNGVASGSARPRSMFTIPGNSFNADHNNGGYACAGVDSPATTSAITYKVQAWNQTSGYPLFINGSNTDSDEANFYRSRTKCMITLMEIAG